MENNQIRKINFGRSERGGFDHAATQRGMSGGQGDHRDDVEAPERVGRRGNRGGSKLPAVTGVDRPERIMINMVPLKSTSNYPIYKYDVSIKVKFSNNYERKISNEKYDASRVICVEIMNKVWETKNGLFVYNRAACIYALKKFDDVTYTVACDDIPACNDNNIVTGKVIIKLATNFQTSTGDLRTSLDASQNSSLLEFVNLLLEKEAFSNPNLWISRVGVHFKVDDNGTRDIGGGVILKNGLKTSANVIGTSIDKLHLVISADIKTMVLHRAQKLDQKLDGLKQLSYLRPFEFLKGLLVQTIYGKKKRFTIQAINKAIHIDSLIEDLGISNREYFKKDYDITLMRADLPMIGRKVSTKILWYPAEMLDIVPHQSVCTERMLSRHHDEKVKFSAMLPADRLWLTQQFMEDLGLLNPEVFRAYGFELGSSFMELPATVLENVRQVNETSLIVPRFNVNVDLNAPFHIAPTIKDWAFVNFGCDANLFDKFKQTLTMVLESKKCRMEAPKEIISTRPSTTPAQIFEMAKRKGYRFLFIILADHLFYHDELRFLEVKTDIVTQLQKVSVVKKLIEYSQKVTIENIVLKTCLKNGGVPYGIDVSAKGGLKIRSNKNLFIGLTFPHQQATSGLLSGKKIPGQIGYGSTCGNHPNMVIGDYRFVRTHDNQSCFDEVTEIVKQCTETFLKNRKIKVLENLVIYISGYTGGQWKILEKTLIPQIKAVLNNIKLIFILESNTSISRLYKINPSGDKAKETNVPAGIVVDHTVFSPLYPAFFLNPHIVLQGTARTPKYIVLLNETNATLRDIEYVTHGLCFLHAVCSTPTAKPAVITVADRCALRGQAVLNYYCRNVVADPEENIDAETVNRELTNNANGWTHGVRYCS